MEEMRKEFETMKAMMEELRQRNRTLEERHNETSPPEEQSGWNLSPKFLWDSDYQREDG